MLRDRLSAPDDGTQPERQGDEAAGGLQLPSRRSFIWKYLVPGSVGGLLVTTTEAAALPGLRSRQTRRNLEEIRRNLHGQVEFIRDAIRDAGGTPRPKPKFRRLRQRNLMAFLLLARAAANSGVAAAHNAASSTFGKRMMARGALVASTTARHAAYLNALLGQPLLGHPSGVEEFDPEEVREMKAAFMRMFVADLNGGPPADFERNNPSPENDLLIANAGLLLKMFEAELYDVNLPRFYRRR